MPTSQNDPSSQLQSHLRLPNIFFFFHFLHSASIRSVPAAKRAAGLASRAIAGQVELSRYLISTHHRIASHLDGGPET